MKASKAVDKIQRKWDEIAKERPPAPTPPFVLAGTSRHQWLPGSPSPLYRTSPWRAAQRLACVSTCPLSIPLLSPTLPERFLLVFPSPAAAEMVFPRLGLRPTSAAAPPAFVVVSGSEPFQVRAYWRMPGLRSVEPGCQWLHTVHWDGSLAPSFAFQSVAVMFAAFFCLPLAFAAVFTSEIRLALFAAEVYIRSRTVPALRPSRARFCLAVCFLIPGDASVSRDPVDLCFNTGLAKSPRARVDPPGERLPWPRFQVLRSSDGSLRVAEDS